MCWVLFSENHKDIPIYRLDKYGAILFSIHRSYTSETAVNILIGPGMCTENVVWKGTISKM